MLQPIYLFMAQGKDGLKAAIITLAVIAIFSISGIVRLITDYWWFDALGFSQIFLISLKAKVLLFLLSASAFFAFIIINLKISSRSDGSKVSFKLKLAVVVALSFLVGLLYSQSWFVVLQYMNQVPFGLQDPIFGKDVSFYVFSLPFILTLRSFLMVCVVAAIIAAIMDYMQSFIADLFKQPDLITPDGATYSAYGGSFKSALSNLEGKALVHLAVLGSLFFLLLAAGHYLARFSIMYSESGIVVGAGYTDVAVYLPIIGILMLVAVAIAVLCLIWIFVIAGKQSIGKSHILATIVALYLLACVLGPTVIPGLVQAYKVSPNEAKLEGPYIENNIKFTKIAYGLDSVVEENFHVGMNLTPEVLSGAQETIDNVRILDWRPLTQTYKQTQEMRLYYDLSGVDVDRYAIDERYTEVMIAPREMNQERLQSKTWVNLHMVYTHGFGAVMSPVNSVTYEGMPNYLIKDIPPTYAVDAKELRIDVPQVYYGEMDNDFVLTNTRTQEFDYPKGDDNEYIHYDGTGGVTLDSFAKKLLMAIRFADVKIMLSSEITPVSKIMFERSIQNRISKITPFLLLDNDPYIVISDGRLFWIQDAYTVTGNFPYSEKYGSINYIRNPVKIVVDAYNGDVTYYIHDTGASAGTNDPIITTYARIFPDQFKSSDTMPESLKSHTRYPEDLFKVQSAIYNTYHMDNVNVFYNKEDAWQIPSEVYGTGQEAQVEPYYIIIKLPGEEKEEFVMMSSFTPIRKDNMVAWLAARSDGDNYGELLLYKFPKDKLVYGPLQIEAKFDQDSVISQQLTLWSTQGSRVTRGNLLVIPIEDSILYIEPLYMQAETGQLPELKRVLVSDGVRVVMEKDLKTALEALFGRTRPTGPGMAEDGYEYGEKSTEELITEAQERYDAILDSMGTNWTAFGENFDRLGEVLEELSGASGNNTIASAT
ncbi:MAG: hypothetical protein C5S47_05630 [Candidatus Methanogasteraceae archaeon]|nr:MAG: hypothetical protein C5S47_05630 [ANME-2 cluster archaeon]